MKDRTFILIVGILLNSYIFTAAPWYISVAAAFTQACTWALGVMGSKDNCAVCGELLADYNTHKSHPRVCCGCCGHTHTHKPPLS